MTHGSAGTMTHTEAVRVDIMCNAMQTHTRCKGTERVTDTMPGTCASIGVQRGEDDTHATAQSSGHVRKPMTGNAGTMTNGGAMIQTARHVLSSGSCHTCRLFLRLLFPRLTSSVPMTHKPSEFVQTHGRWRNGSECRKPCRR